MSKHRAERNLFGFPWKFIVAEWRNRWYAFTKPRLKAAWDNFWGWE